MTAFCATWKRLGMKEKEEILPKRNILFFLKVKEATLIIVSAKNVNSVLGINEHISSSPATTFSKLQKCWC